MLSEEVIKTITKAIKIKYDEHISRLLSIPERHLNKITPNNGLPIIEMLDGFNADTAAEMYKYSEGLQIEINRILQKVQPSSFSQQDKEVILSVLASYWSPDLYIKRFEIMLTSIERKAASYGIKLDLKQFRIDIPKSSCHAGAENATRRIVAMIAVELDCLVLSNQSSPSSLAGSEKQQDNAKRSKFSILNKIWTDPVLSKVIATLILTIVGFCWAWFYKPTKINRVTPPFRKRM